MKYFLNHKWAISGGLGITFFVLFLQVTTNQFTYQLLERLDAILFDIRMQLTLQSDPKDFIKIVDLDERSLKAEGQWPWSRTKVAKLVQKLDEAGAEVIAFDVVFAEPELNAAEKLNHDLAIRGLLKPEHEQLFTSLASDVSNDQYFAQTLSESNVVLGSMILAEGLNSGRLGVPIAGISQRVLDRLVMHNQDRYTGPLTVLQDANGGHTGFINTFADVDSIIRRSPLVMRYKQALYPSLSLAAAIHYLGNVRAKPVYLEQSADVVSLAGIRLGDYIIPTDDLGNVIVNFQAKRAAYDYLSATDVLNGKYGKGSLDGTILFVGTSAQGLADLRSTPLASAVPGVEVHASLVDSYLSQRVPVKPGWEIGALVLLTFSLGVFLATLMPILSPAKLMLTSLLSLVVIVSSNYYLWAIQLFDLTMFTPILLVLLLMIWNVGFGLFEENSQRQRIKSMFGQYVPADHVEHMLNDDTQYSVDGESREMTVMFADIRNFTAISESLSAAELKQALNRFFTPITHQIFENKGTIDKYVGDMVMAFWGAPLTDPDHRRHAIDAAFAMLEATETLKTAFKADGLPEFSLGIGINTGQMNVGDMGSEFRRAYTVIGDSVNLGSRIEGLTKFYKAKLLVSEFVIEGVSDYQFLLTDYITVKGKKEPIKIYQPLGLISAINEATLQQVDIYHRALDAYYKQNWDKAFDRFRRLNKFIHLREMYIQRILAMQGNPPGDAWDGVYRHQSKG